MLRGEFTEHPTDEHCALRDRLLAEDAVHPTPEGVLEAEAAAFPETGVARLRDQLERRGLALVQLDEPLPNDSFRRLGDLLGTPTPETDPAVQPYVDDTVILNLRADQGRTADVSLQPFATGPLTLHSEGSGRAVAEQPRYIVLMCCDPGTAASASTVLVPMEAVTARLSDEDLHLLMATRYADRPGVPTVARRDGRRVVYSFRDFHGTPLRWTCQAPRADEQAVHGAMRRLLAEMYRPEPAYAVTWRRGLLVVIDNHRFFHGRTAGSAQGGDRPRHLKRLRVRTTPDG